MNNNVPKIILEECKKLTEGHTFVSPDKKAIIRTVDLDNAGLETLNKLSSSVSAPYWESLEFAVGERWLPVVLQAILCANINYSYVRKIFYQNDSPPKSRKVEIEKTINKLKDNIKAVVEDLDHLYKMTRNIAPIRSRFPDKWPDSPTLRRELEHVIDVCNKFDFENISSEEVINSALNSRKSGRAYLRALITMLDAQEFPFGENRLPPAGLVDLASLAALGCNADFGYDDVYKILNPPAKKIPRKNSLLEKADSSTGQQE